MTEVEFHNEIINDIRDAPAGKVLYLEGKSDHEAFLALLGRTKRTGVPSESSLLDQIQVRGLGGTNEVKKRVTLSERMGLKGVSGIVDGDGDEYVDLARDFDPPSLGPLFRWKAYCIENLLVKTGWPAAFGPEPDWRAELPKYSPYVAFNRIQREVMEALRTLKLTGYTSPRQKIPLRTTEEILAAIEADKHRLAGDDLPDRFLAAVREFEMYVQHDMDRAHAALNGKWIIEHLAPTLTGQSADRCRAGWLAHAVSAGGLPEVREWWGRLTGASPELPDPTPSN